VTVKKVMLKIQLHPGEFSVSRRGAVIDQELEILEQGEKRNYI